MVDQNYLNPEKEKQEERQYVSDLIEISGGFPKKGIVNKIGFILGFVTNGVIYYDDEPLAHQKAEGMRRMIKSLVNDL